MPAWKVVWAGRSVSSPWPESVASFWRHALRLRGSSARRFEGGTRNHPSISLWSFKHLSAISGRQYGQMSRAVRHASARVTVFAIS